MNTNFENNPFYKDEPKKAEKGNPLIKILQPLAAIAIIALVIWFTILGQNQVDGPSMRATFYTGEFLLVNRLPALLGEGVSKGLGINYERGDVVILQVPGQPEFVKRVIGLPGERIAIDKGRVFINDKVMIEDYLPDKLYTNGGDFIREGGQPIEIPEGNLIAIGDNRPESNDSRYQEIGLVKRQWIKGKVFIRIWPSNTFGFIPRGTFSFADPTTYNFDVADKDYRHPTKLTPGYCKDFIRQCYYAD